MRVADIDECAGVNQCGQLCENEPGGYRCACNVGFLLNDDLLTCSRKFVKLSLV